MMRRRGMGRSQAQGAEPASWVKGSAEHHQADLMMAGTRKAVPIARVVAGFTSCSPQSG
jgi:hypothetical protein